MIVKNEARNLPSLLAPIYDLFDEICVCDTGSTDRTIEIAHHFDAKVTCRPWDGSFGAARNAALSLATARWAVWLDADDRMNRLDVELLRNTLTFAEETMGFFIRLFSTNENPDLVSECEQLRVHPVSPYVYWEGPVHEQINLSFERMGGIRVAVPQITVYHTGYHTAKMLDGKYRRNLDILMKQRARGDDDAALNLHIAQTLSAIGDKHAAYQEFKRLAAYEGDMPFQKTLATRALYMMSALQREFTAESALTLMREAFARSPEDDFLRVELAEFLVAMSQNDEARELLRPIANKPGLSVGILPYPTLHEHKKMVGLWRAVNNGAL